MKEIVWLLGTKKQPKCWPSRCRKTLWRHFFLTLFNALYLSLHVFFIPVCLNFRPFEILIKGRRRVLYLCKGQYQKPGPAFRIMNYKSVHGSWIYVGMKFSNQSFLWELNSFHEFYSHLILLGIWSYQFRHYMKCIRSSGRLWWISTWFVNKYHVFTLDIF